MPVDLHRSSIRNQLPFREYEKEIQLDCRQMKTKDREVDCKCCPCRFRRTAPESETELL
jgi:hypothetical protein